MKKRILIISQYFYPENFKSNDIAFELVKRGYEVSVLTGIPNYPEGKFFDKYGIFKNTKQNIQGVKVHRAFLIPRKNGKGLWLILNYISWAICASFKAINLSLKYKYDSIIVHEPSPITQGIPAIIVKKIQKIPIYFWVLDLWPESLTSSGNIRNKTVLSLTLNLVQFIYNRSDKILVSSKGFRKSILEKGDYDEKIIYFPNWAEEVFVNNNSKIEVPQLPEGFNIMFAGNIGESQDLENILNAALLLKDENINFIFIGDGRKRVWADYFVKTNNLDKVYIWGRYPLDSMPAFFRQADLMLVSLKDESIFNLTVPAKIQAYMMAGKAIIAMLNGDGADIISDANCGKAVNAGDYKMLAKEIRFLKSKTKSELNAYGMRGQLYYEKNFKKEKCIENLCNILESS